MKVQRQLSGFKKILDDLQADDMEYGDEMNDV